MIFLVDAQLPPALARKITEFGHAAHHVADIGLAEASDLDIWNYAQENGGIIVTKDEDFSILHTFFETGPAVIWLRIRNCRKQVLLETFDRLWPRMMDQLMQGESLIEVIG